MRSGVEKTLVPWCKRNGLRVSDVYRDTFHYVDVVDDAGRKYEISISADKESDLIKVRCWDYQKKRCGSTTDLSDLEKVLDKAYSRITKWIEQSKRPRILAAVTGPPISQGIGRRLTLNATVGYSYKMTCRMFYFSLTT